MRSPANSAGFSLLELMIALGASTIALLFVPALFLQLRKSEQSVQERVTSISDDLVGFRQLLGQLEKSGVMRTGLFDCSGVSLPTSCTEADGTCESEAVLDLGADSPQPLEFAFATYSTMAARDPLTRDRLQLADGAFFPKGSILIVSQAHRPEFSGLFRVFSVDSLGISLSKLETGALIGPEGFRCRVSDRQMSLEQILEDNATKIYGNLARTVRLDRIALSSYFRTVAQNGKPAVSSRVFPSPLDPQQANAVPGASLSGIARLRISSVFKRDDQESASGRYLGTVFLEASNERGAKDSKQASVTYRLTRSLTQNFAAITSVESAELPELVTCGLVLQRVSGQYFRKVSGAYKSDDQFRELYSVSATVSGSSSSDLTVKMDGLTPSAPYGCETLSAPDTLLTAGAAPITGSFLLDMSGNATICEFNPGVEVTGELKFYDSALKVLRTVECTPAAVPDGTVSYRSSSGSGPTCRGDGSIQSSQYLAERDGAAFGFGPLVVPRSCCWKADCNSGPPCNFDDCSIKAGKNLCKVKFGPRWTGVTALASEVNCAP